MAQPEEILSQIRDQGIRMVDLRFTDLVGRFRHTAIDAAHVDHTILEHGLFIDGSSVPGWRDVSESDLLLKPDLCQFFADPFTAQPTLAFFSSGSDPATGMGYERDPRSAARRAALHLRDLGVADEVLVAGELDFFLFDDVRVETGPLGCGYRLEASESPAAAGRAYANGNPGHRPAPGDGYLAMPPSDHLAEIRAEIATMLASLGIERVQHRHGRATNQCEISSGPASLLVCADRIQLIKYVIHQVAASYGKSATFMAKPLAEQTGSGLRINLSLRRQGEPLFAGQGYADLSPLCLSFIAGVLAHARALNAFTNPTCNSYRRMRAGMDEPVMLTYAAFNRSAAIRIPFAAQASSKRIEIRFPDPSANPYLALVAILMAGLDGVERKLEPGDAMDRNLYDLQPAEIEDLPRGCQSFEEALEALESDHEFLTRGDVMPPDLIEGYIEVKKREIEHLARTPHPLEFQLYYSL